MGDVRVRVPGPGAGERRRAREQGFGSAKDALRSSLDRLGLDFVDLYLIHWPLPRLDRYVESWLAMEELLDLTFERLELTYAAERMSAVEVNGSFYSLQRPSSYAAWSAADGASSCAANC